MKFFVEWIETEERKSDNSHYNWSQNDRNCWNDVFTLFLIEFRIFITQCGNKFSEDDDVQYEYDQEQRKYADFLELFPKIFGCVAIHKCSSLHTDYQNDL